MINLLRKIIPRKIINTFWHFPVAILANIINGFPSRKIKVIGVTGTDGKTTTTNMIYQILKTAGKNVSMVSTINASLGEKKYDIGFHVTSPHSFTVQKFLRQAIKAKSEFMVLEVTSHALDQHRFLGVKFDIGVITNITHEHLDYHKSFQNYLNAKSKLIKKVRIAVLNHDEKHFKKLSKKTSGSVVSFGFSKEANFNPNKFPINVSISGRFNILNGLAASAAAVNLGINPKDIKRALKTLKSLEGRMQQIQNSKGVKIIIDFAHTPNALEQALKALKIDKKGKIIAVFGCAGQRDIEKRFLMGEIASRLSDLVVITAEDPRGKIDEINTQIIQGTKRSRGELDKNVFIINDRQKAIEYAINILAKKGDTVGIFGKGHEKSMNLDGKRELPWSDQLAVEKALKSHEES